MSYIIISPIKDEEVNLSSLINTILNQTTKPLIWVIVDSGSSDNSFKIAIELSQGYDWIHVIKQKKFFEAGYGHKNFAQAISEGYSYTKILSEKINLSYKYIGKVDASVSLAENYFETLIAEMEIKSDLVVNCGIQNFILNNGKKITIFPSHNDKMKAFNDIRLYRKDFFEMIGGYPLSPSPDTIILIKALNRGFDINVSEKTFFNESRVGGTKIGIWEGYKMKGKTMYSLGYHFVLLTLNGLYNSFKFPPHYQILPIWQGYVTSIIRKDEKVKDVEVLDYFGKKRLKMLLKLSKQK